MRKQFTILQISVLVFVMLSFPLTLLAQGITTAAINGVVTDKDGKPLQGATIQALHDPSGAAYGNTTREDGRYNLQNLRVGGPYTIKVSYVGFAPQIKKTYILSWLKILKLISFC